MSCTWWDGGIKSLFASLYPSTGSKIVSFQQDKKMHANCALENIFFLTQKLSCVWQMAYLLFYFEREKRNFLMPNPILIPLKNSTALETRSGTRGMPFFTVKQSVNKKNVFWDRHLFLHATISTHNSDFLFSERNHGTVSMLFLVSSMCALWTSKSSCFLSSQMLLSSTHSILIAKQASYSSSFGLQSVTFGNIARTYARQCA